MDIEEEYTAPQGCICSLADVPDRGRMVCIRDLDPKALSRYQGVSSLVVTVGDEGSYGQGVNGGSRTSHGYGHRLRAVLIVVIREDECSGGSVCSCVDGASRAAGGVSQGCSIP